MSSFATLQANNNQIQSLLQNLSHGNFQKIKALSKKNKIIVYSVDNLIASGQDFLSEARRFAQLNLLVALSNNNTKDFQLAIDNIKFFYENTLNSSPSNEYYMVTSIHLLFLLSSHKNQQFYAKIQTLNTNNLKNSYISYVLLLNEAIQQGNYRRVFQLKKQSPLNYFSPFLNRISQTVRFQIAKSAQKAYSELSIVEALKIFQLQNQTQLRQFIQRYCQDIEEQLVRWIFNNGKIIFEKANRKNIIFNSDQLILTTLNYAHQLQRIA